MGKKIRLSGARFGMDAQSEQSSGEIVVVQPKNNVSALKRIGKPNSPVAAMEAEPVMEVEENTATRFMVTVTNDRSGQNGNSAPETNEFNARSLPRQSSRPLQNPVQSRLGNLNNAQSNQVTDSSIEVIDLDNEPDVAVVGGNSRSSGMNLGRSNLSAFARRPPPPQQSNPIGQQLNQRLNNRQGMGGGKVLNLNKDTRPNIPALPMDNDLSMQNRKRKAPSFGMSREDQRIQASLATASDEEKAPLPGGRRKLFVAGFPNRGGTKESEIKELFEKYGKVEEIWMNMEKGFGFLKLDTKINAEKAKMELDKSSFKERTLNVKVASQSSVVKVSNLGDFVTNELLRDAFEAFGDLERVVVACDYHLKPLGYGFVEFANKKRAEMAIRKINENPFVLTKSVKPISVKPLDDNDEEDGVSSKNIRPSQQAMIELSERPRFLEEGTFEYDVALKWKMQYMFEERQRQYLEQQLEESRARLEIEVEDMYKNHKSWILREELRRRQAELERLEKFQTGDSMLDNKRAYLDRAAQHREEQFRMEEENFMKHQEQLRRNAEVHLVQQMAGPKSPAYDVPYGGGAANRMSGGIGGGMGRMHEFDSPNLMMDSPRDQRASYGGGLSSGTFSARDSLEYGSATSTLSAARALMAGKDAGIQRGGLSSRLGGLKSNAGNDFGDRMMDTFDRNDDVQPIRRQQYY